MDFTGYFLPADAQNYQKPASNSSYLCFLETPNCSGVVYNQSKNSNSNYLILSSSYWGDQALHVFKEISIKQEKLLKKPGCK